MPLDHLDEPIEEDRLAPWLAALASTAEEFGGRLAGALQTLHAVNDFPRLPIRSDTEAMVTVLRFATHTDWQRAAERLAALDAAGGSAAREREVRLLQPTARSSLR